MDVVENNLNELGVVNSKNIVRDFGKLNNLVIAAKIIDEEEEEEEY